MKKLLLGELLARVAEPESPEERDAAWDEVVARFDELVVVRERAERLERQVQKEAVEGENAWERLAELEARLGRAAAAAELSNKDRRRLYRECEALTGLVWELGRRLRLPGAEIDELIVAATPDPFAVLVEQEKPS